VGRDNDLESNRELRKNGSLPEATLPPDMLHPDDNDSNVEPGTSVYAE
jgi:hypothetical protein